MQSCINGVLYSYITAWYQVMAKSYCVDLLSNDHQHSPTGMSAVM